MSGIKQNQISKNFFSSVPEWVTGTPYKLNYMIRVEDMLYVCIEAHTSSVDFATDLAKWLPVGGSGSGVGGGFETYSLIYADETELEGFTSNLTTSTIVVNDTAPISGETDYKIENLTGASGHVLMPEITLSERAKGKSNSVSFVYKYDGDNNDFNVIVEGYNGTWSTISDTLQLEFSSIVKKAEIPFFVATDITKIRVKINLAVANNGKILQFNDFQFSDSPFQYANFGELNTFFAKIPSSGTTITEQIGKNDKNQNAIASMSWSGNVCTLTLTSGFFSATPHVITAPFRIGSVLVDTSHIQSVSNTQIVIETGILQSGLYSGSPMPFNITITKAGVDFNQNEHIVTPMRSGSQIIRYDGFTSRDVTTENIKFKVRRYNLDSIGNDSSELFSDDNSGNFTKIIANKEIIVSVHFIALGAVGTPTIRLYDKSNVLQNSFFGASQATTNYSESSITIRLPAGWYITARFASNLIDDPSVLFMVSATPLYAEFMAAVPLAETVSFRQFQNSVTTASAGNEVTIPLNTTISSKGWANLNTSTNQITITAGRYLIYFNGELFDNSSSNAAYRGFSKLRNITDGLDIDSGKLIVTGTGNTGLQSSNNTIEVEFTASKILELRGRTIDNAEACVWGTSASYPNYGGSVVITKIK